MKLFAVDEPADIIKPGIRILPGESPVGLRWGASGVIPVAKAQYKAVRAALEAGKFETHFLRLERADIFEDGDKGLRFEIEKDPRDQRALVYVYTSTLAADRPMRMGPDDAIPNTVTFTSPDPFRVTEGEGTHQRAKRIHPPFSEVVGVTVVKSEQITVDGATWNEALITMVPGSSFRIVRGGDTRDIVPEFLVVWNGHKLQTVIPARYRQRVEETMAMA